MRTFSSLTNIQRDEYSFATECAGICCDERISLKYNNPGDPNWVSRSFYTAKYFASG